MNIEGSIFYTNPFQDIQNSTLTKYTHIAILICKSGGRAEHLLFISLRWWYVVKH